MKAQKSDYTVIAHAQLKGKQADKFKAVIARLGWSRAEFIRKCIADGLGQYPDTNPAVIY